VLNSSTLQEGICMANLNHLVRFNDETYFSVRVMSNAMGITVDQLLIRLIRGALVNSQFIETADKGTSLRVAAFQVQGRTQS
jgi:hypothetical protein